MKSTRDNIVIGIDTSCYTTSIAAISLNKEIIFNEKIMLNVDTNSKGLRQSEAVFKHVSNIVHRKNQDLLKGHICLFLRWV